MFYPSGTGGIVPGRYGGKVAEEFGHSEMTGKVKMGYPYLWFHFAKEN